MIVERQGRDRVRGCGAVHALQEGKLHNNQKKKKKTADRSVCCCDEHRKKYWYKRVQSGFHGWCKGVLGKV